MKMNKMKTSGQLNWTLKDTELIRIERLQEIMIDMFLPLTPGETVETLDRRIQLHVGLFLNKCSQDNQPKTKTRLASKRKLGTITRWWIVVRGCGSKDPQNHSGPAHILWDFDRSCHICGPFGACRGLKLPEASTRRGNVRGHLGCGRDFPAALVSYAYAHGRHHDCHPNFISGMTTHHDPVLNCFKSLVGRLVQTGNGLKPG